ncbi:MAG: menF [Naasia sp.]|nr:menF [Naasia sp.]
MLTAAPLSVVSTAAPAGTLLETASSRAPLVWLRGGDGLVGVGEAVRLEFTGPDRVAEAAAAWRALVDAAEMRDEVGVPGSGLVAFGAFAFGDVSAHRSVLIVPRLLVGRRSGIEWRTRIAGGTATAAGDPVGPVGSAPRLRFSPGTLSPDGYRAAVAEAVLRIERGAFAKAVLARDLTARLPRTSDLRRVLRDLAADYPDCWTFAVDGLIGSSPETLVRVDAGRVTSRVLAGSASRGSTDHADRDSVAALLASAKDRDEHRFAVRSVLAGLRSHTSGLRASDAPFPLELPNLWHLASDVAGVLADGSSALDLVDALHPTAAVAGFPTPAALAAIAELEPFDRGRYAGPVGWIDASGSGEWAVALRCAQLTADGRVTAYAGAGIVAGSEPEQELAETDLKFAPIVGAFGQEA